MTKCVFRTDLRQRPTGEPIFCIDAINMFFRPGLPTVERCVRSLLTQDEICLGASDTRAIMRGPRLVGYIRIVDEWTWSSGAAARR